MASLMIGVVQRTETYNICRGGAAQRTHESRLDTWTRHLPSPRNPIHSTYSVRFPQSVPAHILQEREALQMINILGELVTTE